jgi:hypothetical protein
MQLFITLLSASLNIRNIHTSLSAYTNACRHTCVYVCADIEIYAGTRNTLPLQARRTAVLYVYYTCTYLYVYYTRPPQRWMNVHVYVRFPSSSSFFLSSRLQKLRCVNACMHAWIHHTVHVHVCTHNVLHALCAHRAQLELATRR